MTIPGFTSTGSKGPAALFGIADVPRRMARAEGCRLWDAEGREYHDTVMALGAVGLGYAHPAVVGAVRRAARDGVVGSLPPLLEAEVAGELGAVLPGVEGVRFLKTGAEAVAAAVRIARVHTGRERVVTCGYAGWLDWCQDAAGVPDAVRGLRRSVPFNDVPALERAMDEFGPVAALVIEPVVNEAPHEAWLRAARRLASRHGAVLVFDEIKTAFRLAVGGVAQARGITPDLTVVGKALGNGLPIAAVAGPRALMEAATRTWISSTLATECVSLAAARAVLEVYRREDVIGHLERIGRRLHDGFAALHAAHGAVVTGVRGVPQMCFLEFASDALSGEVARAALERGLLFKRSAYNFVSLAHQENDVETVLARLDDALAGVERAC